MIVNSRHHIKYKKPERRRKQLLFKVIRGIMKFDASVVRARAVEQHQACQYEQYDKHQQRSIQLFLFITFHRPPLYLFLSFYE